MASSAPPNPLAPSLSLERDATGQSVVRVSGAWNLRAIGPVAPVLCRQLAAYTGDLQWDLSGVTRFDHAEAMMLWHAWGKRRAGQVEMRAEHDSFFTHIETGPTVASRYKRQPERRRPLWVAGRSVVTLGMHIIQVVALLGSVSLVFLKTLRHPSRLPWKEISANVYRTGAQALGITALVACHFGLCIEPNGESLGVGTTNSVVAAITIVIIADACFAIVFSHVGIS